jgi:hypothetical protein
MELITFIGIKALSMAKSTLNHVIQKHVGQNGLTHIFLVKKLICFQKTHSMVNSLNTTQYSSWFVLLNHF